MRAFKSVIAIVLAAALCAGIFILLQNEGKEPVAQAGGETPSGTVVINEFMASNGGCLTDDKGETPDWIELYNPGGEDVSLSGLGLSDDKINAKWAFPAVTLKAGGYLVVFASGKSETDPAGVLHTNFKLSADGGGIYLTDTSGKAVDAVEYEAQTKNVSMGRLTADTGTWSAFASPTPGYPNDEAGAQAFAASRYAGDSPLILTEVMASNKTTLTDNTGAYSDYVEIYNKGAEPVSLLGYGLSDDPQSVLGWKFPDVTIQPGAYLVVFASGQGVAATDLEKGAIHANFSISSYKEVITLASPLGLILDAVTVSESQADRAYARGFDGAAYTDEWAPTSKPSPGYVNTEDGYSQFSEANPIALGDIVISEVMTSNQRYLAEDNGATYDWVELYNRGSQTVSLLGYGLTNNTGNPAKFRLPDKTLGPGEYYTVLASGLAGDETIKKNYVHTTFKLSAGGEILALFNADGVLQDKLNIGALPRGLSIGRMAQQDGIFYFTGPTPGTANSNPSGGFVAEPSASVPAGSYASAQTVALACATQGATIRYTTDGTVPTQSSPEYAGPIAMGQTGLVRVKAFREGYLDSGTFTATYVIGASHTLPVISLVCNPDDLFNEQTGIYKLGPNAQLIENSPNHYEVANYLIRGKASERPASFELFDESGTRLFEQDVAIRISGAFSRDNQQKSFSVIARSEYGKGAMAYPFFSELPFTEYKSFVLRNGGQDQWYAKIKEAVLLNLLGGQTNFLSQRCKPYVVYLNGEYWGVYFMQEKRSTDFVAQHENVANPDSINLIIGSGGSNDSRHLKNGTNEDYKALIAYVTSHDMSLKENFDHLAAQLDTDSFMDLMIHQIYVANTDDYNMEFYQTPGGKWKQIFYDMCWSFNKPSHETVAFRMKDSTCGSTMFTSLLAYQPWKEAFIKRFAWSMQQFYTVEHFVGVIDEMAGLIASEMPAERAKFTDTKTNWDDSVENMRKFAKQRPYEILKQLKSVLGVSGSTLRGYFSFSDEQMKSGFNLTDEQMRSLFG